jgi:hypothetical protein
MAAYEGEVLNEKPEQVSGAAVPTAVDFEAQYKDKAEKLKADYDKKVKELTTSTLKVGGETYEIPSVLTSTPVVAAATVVGLYGAKKAGEYLYDKTASALNGIKNRMINKGPDVSAPSPIGQQPVTEKPKSSFAQQFETTYGVPLSKAEELTGGPITNPRDAAIVGGALKNQSGISVTSPYQITSPPPIPFELDEYSKSGMVTRPQTNAPVSPVDPFAPRPNPYMTPSVQTGVQTGNATQAVQAVVAQELDKATGVAPTEPATPKSPKKEPAVATFKTLADVPEGFVFRSDVGNVDRSLGNILGLEHRANAREMFTGGKPFGQFTGSGPTAYNDEISRLTTDYFKKLQSEIPETILSRDARRAQGIPSDFGTYAKTTNFGKAAKVGGVAGTLIAAADIANAGQQGKYGEAAVRSADLATDYIPMVAQLKQGLAPTEAGAPGVSKQRIESSALLGSPYAQTEWAKNQRLKKKAGAGRGIAPPSAYMR